MKQFDEKGAQLLGMSVDSTFALKTWATAMGGIRHPLLADFWPHGGAAQALGILNEGVGIANRSLFIIDPKGIIRHSEAHTSTLPDVAATLDRLDELQG
ncbi:MAG: hypothetical protein CMQ29_01690 [Gammaproteobacteria bacterium]|nr:hypothetical protein [Gammaproteobacteria bacterium]